MTGKKEKTISGAMYSAPNLEHNLRTHIPPNSVEERRHLNWVYSKDSEITLQQVYEKLFAGPYKEWRDREIKKGRGKRDEKSSKTPRFPGSWRNWGSRAVWKTLKRNGALNSPRLFR